MIHTTQTYQIGDNVELMRKMSAETIDMIVTSPPYWGLRDYGVDGQIGLEPTLEEYHARMLEVTAECMRLLKPTGVMFWNMGDSYANANTAMSEYSIDDEWLRLLGWIYTDGTILRDGDKICIYQTKQRGIDEIERLLSVLNLEYSKYGPYKRNYQYYVHAPDSRRINEMLCFNGTKILPNWLGVCSRRQIMILLQAIIDGDGTKRKYDTVVYGTEDRLLPLETLLNKKNISCKLWQNARGDWILQIHQELRNPKFFHEKSMIMQNERLIIRMIDDQGWILRNRIIWNKPNGMPSSVSDRFSNKYEPVYMLTKNQRYWFDLDAVRAPYTEPMNRWGGQKLKADGDSKYANGDVQGGYRERDMRPNPLGKNPGDVWTIPTQPYPESHFATFPTALIEPMIRAACPEGGTVLDPFCGSGTVLEVCRLLNRNAIGLELNPEYETLIKDRSMAHTPPLTAY